MDEKIITEWYEKYSVGIYRFALAILGNPYSAEDVLQETFAKVLKTFGTDVSKTNNDAIHICKTQWKAEGENLLRNGKEQAWLYTVARNCCYDILRKKKKEELADEIKESLQTHMTLNASSTLEYVDMIAGLNQTEKEIVSLRIIGGLTHKQIAKVMGMTVGGAKKRYERAIQKLRMEFE